jgi:hypothetical protein
VRKRGAPPSIAAAPALSSDGRGGELTAHNNATASEPGSAAAVAAAAASNADAQELQQGQLKLHASPWAWLSCMVF